MEKRDVGLTLRGEARRAHYAALLEEHKRSGKPLTVFAREQGLPVTRLKHWVQEFRKGKEITKGEGGIGQLLPVEVIAGPRRAESHPTSRGAVIEIDLTSGRRLRMSGNITPAQFASFVEALENPC